MIGIQDNARVSKQTAIGTRGKVYHGKVPNNDKTAWDTMGPKVLKGLQMVVPK